MCKLPSHVLDLFFGQPGGERCSEFKAGLFWHAVPCGESLHPHSQFWVSYFWLTAVSDLVSLGKASDWPQLVILPYPPKCWHCRCAPPCPAPKSRCSKPLYSLISVIHLYLGILGESTSQLLAIWAPLSKSLHLSNSTFPDLCQDK